MNDSIRLGRVAGIPIGVNWTVLAIGGLITWTLAGRLLPGTVPGLEPLAYWATGLGVAALFLASLLAHELAHAVVARRNGLEVEGITLWLLGGVAKLRGEAATPGADARIAAVGPAASFVIAGVAWVAATALGGLDLAGPAALLVVGAQWLSVVNLVLGGFNLLPGAPLDGGRVARAVVWAWRGDRLLATRVATGLGRLLGAGLIVMGAAEIVIGADLGGLWSIVLGIFLASAAGLERRQAEVVDALAGATVGQAMSRELPLAPASLTADAFVEHLLPGSRASTWVVIGPDGEPAGLLPLERLGRLKRPASREVRIGALAIPLADLATTTVGEPLVELLGRLDEDETGARAKVVDDEGRIAGFVLPEDVARAVEVGRLRPRTRAGRGGPTGRTAPDAGG